jgi:hypothetical protein
MNTIDSRTVIPLNGYPKSTHIPSALRKHNGHLPTIVENKPISNGHIPSEPVLAIDANTPVKQPAQQFVTPAIEVRTSA